MEISTRFNFNLCRVSYAGMVDPQDPLWYGGPIAGAGDACLLARLLAGLRPKEMPEAILRLLC